MNDGYVGGKFEFRRLLNGPAPSLDLVSEMLFWGRLFHHLDLAPPYEGGSFGNMGFKDRDGHIRVTPSERSIGNLVAEDIMTIIDVQERPGKPPLITGYGNKDREPTSEAQIYFELFRARPKAKVILHGHDEVVKGLSDLALVSFPNTNITTNFQEYGTPECDVL